MNRLQNAAEFIVKRDFDNSLLNIVTIIDKSAKDTYHIDGVGKRFRKLLDDNQDLLYWVMTNGKAKPPIDSTILFSEDNFGSKTHTLSALIYKPLRNCLVHDAEIPKNIMIGNKLGFENGNFNMPVLLIWGLLFMLISLPCNLHLKWDCCIIYYNNRPIDLNDCWGNKQLLMEKLKGIFPAKTMK